MLLLESHVLHLLSLLRLACMVTERTVQLLRTSYLGLQEGTRVVFDTELGRIIKASAFPRILNKLVCAPGILDPTFDEVVMRNATFSSQNLSLQNRGHLLVPWSEM